MSGEQFEEDGCVEAIRIGPSITVMDGFAGRMRYQHGEDGCRAVARSDVIADRGQKGGDA